MQKELEKAAKNEDIQKFVMKTAVENPEIMKKMLEDNPKLVAKALGTA